ncbi:helix-turn-helix domain-containing protein [Streptomyces sp. RKCA744]|uniref:helix-turn-helix domain-containing protein n=2 Tax=Streptomyces TaxID=1883 RepID=UPI0035ABF397
MGSEAGQELPPERAAFARELRELFGTLNVSLRQYSARSSMPATSLARYLNGTRLPPWSVVVDLLRAVAEDRGEAVNTADMDRLQDLYQQAAPNGSVLLRIQAEDLRRQLAALQEEMQRTVEQRDEERLRVVRAIEMLDLQREELRRATLHETQDYAVSRPDLLALSERPEAVSAATELAMTFDQVFRALGPPPPGLLSEDQPVLRGNGGGSEK